MTRVPILVALLAGAAAGCRSQAPKPAPLAAASAGLDLTVCLETGAELARERIALEPWGRTWRPSPPVRLPFADVVSVELSRDADAVPPGPVSIRVEYLMHGAEDPDRRVALFVTARDAGGRALLETWRLSRDARIDAHALDGELEGRIAVGPPVNRARCELPPEPAWPASIELRFDEMSRAEWYHFPLEPSRHGLTMTRPDVSGGFELAFGFPAGTAWRRDELACVVVLRELDLRGNELGREVRSLDAPDPDGRFRARFRLPPEHVDSASVQLVFFSRQPDNERFVDAHFRGLGELAFGGGQWSQSSCALIHVPFAP